MKEIDLMIGDWVLVTAICGWDCEPIPLQVRGVEYNSYKGEDYCDWVSTDCDDEVSLSYIQPIPLTAEILKLNGWEKHPFTHALHLHEDRLSITLGESYSRFVHYHLCGVGTDCVETEYCSEIDFVGTLYVHQLQHALRLCGLNELADNFKVLKGE